MEEKSKFILRLLTFVCTDRRKQPKLSAKIFGRKEYDGHTRVLMLFNYAVLTAGVMLAIRRSGTKIRKFLRRLFGSQNVNFFFSDSTQFRTYFFHRCRFYYCDCKFLRNVIPSHIIRQLISLYVMKEIKKESKFCPL